MAITGRKWRHQRVSGIIMASASNGRNNGESASNQYRNSMAISWHRQLAAAAWRLAKAGAMAAPRRNMAAHLVAA
jgi:hypothetical protein